TRPEGLGGSRDAGPAVAGPRPPYVTEAVRGGYGTATPYSGYGRTGRTGRPYGRPTLAGSKDSPPTLRRHEARRPKIKDTIDWLEKHAFFCRKVGPGPDESIEHSYGTRPEGLGGSRDAGPAVAGPRPPYVTEAERHNNVGGGYGTATPYSGYGRTGRTGRTKEGT
ncbi:hypothetical protein L249_5977, partial [Ophiocordyceps polyrhachis-furcata BCC 54312]